MGAFRVFVCGAGSCEQCSVAQRALRTLPRTCHSRCRAQRAAPPRGHGLGWWTCTQTCTAQSCQTLPSTSPLWHGYSGAHLHQWDWNPWQQGDCFSSETLSKCYTRNAFDGSLSLWHCLLPTGCLPYSSKETMDENSAWGVERSLRSLWASFAVLCSVWTESH